jgi:hypothetical protein
MGCNKKEEGGTTTTTSSGPGCGSDASDPAKEYCVKVPAGYTASKPDAPNALYSELINYNGPNSGFSITVGFTSSNWKTYDDQLKADTKSSQEKTPTASGKTGGTGQWWVYKDRSGTQTILATAKSNGDKAIRCSPNNSTVTPEVIEACKTIRAYPK